MLLVVTKANVAMLSFKNLCMLQILYTFFYFFDSLG
jgi:hypothetical protein